MQLDIYRRPEPEHKLSFLAVPAGNVIPEEAVSAEWQLHVKGVQLDEGSPAFAEYGIDNCAGQLAEKGYAITSVTHQVADGQ